MKKNKYYIYWIAIGLFFTCTNTTWTSAQTDSISYYVPRVLQYDNVVYKPNIKTVLLTISNNELSDPILHLRSTEQLMLRFDELGDEAHTYSYTLIHCNANWQASDLDPMEYMGGFLRDDITDYTYSFNITQQYVHYKLIFPNNNIKLVKSGNYLLKVYANDNPKDLVLTRRFVLYEDLLQINLSFLPSGVSPFFASHQRIDFDINYAQFSVSNPIAELKVSVLQNGRWDNALQNLSPTFLGLNKVIYQASDKILFKAGNEFRFFDARKLRTAGVRVQRIEKRENAYHLHLQVDETNDGERNNKSYRRDSDGKYYIGVNDGIFSRLDADYVYVHFYLSVEKPLTNGNLYVFGALTDWQTSTQTQMHYRPEMRAYEAVLYLKQGFYDYQYVSVRDGNDPKPDPEFAEGSYVSTENTYYILAYHRGLADRYDRVVGFACASGASGNLWNVRQCGGR